MFCVLKKKKCEKKVVSSFPLALKMYTRQIRHMLWVTKQHKCSFYVFIKLNFELMGPLLFCKLRIPLRLFDKAIFTPLITMLGPVSCNDGLIYGRICVSLWKIITHTHSHKYTHKWMRLTPKVLTAINYPKHGFLEVFLYWFTWLISYKVHIWKYIMGAASGMDAQSLNLCHLSVMASQITDNLTFCSTASGWQQGKHQEAPHHWPFGRKSTVDWISLIQDH